MRPRALIRTLALVLPLLGLPAAAFSQEDFSAVRIEPARPTPQDPIRIAVTVGAGEDPDLRLVEVQGNRIVFHYNLYDYPADRPLPPTVRWTTAETLDPLPAGVYTVEVTSSDHTGFQRTFEVAGPSPALVLQENEDSVFTVTVDLEPQASNPSGTGYGVPITLESGYFWFFSPRNVELTIKILDGRGTNGRYWVFLASMTDLPFTVTVEQCPAGPGLGQPCIVKTYTNPKGVNRNYIDVNAFSEL